MITKKSYEEAKTRKRKEYQKLLTKVLWKGYEVTENSWEFNYLGSIYEAGGGHMHGGRKETNSNGVTALRKDVSPVE